MPTDSTLAGFNHERFYLGGPCRREHLWGDTGKTLREKKKRECIECGLIRGKQRRPRWGQGNIAHRVFKLNQDEYNELLNKHGNFCAICGDPPGSKALALDHCHKTMRMRGFLCSACNAALGLMKDDPQRLLSAIAYLDHYAHSIKKGTQ